MNLHPWDIWQKDGSPHPWTAEILAVIESILADSAYLSQNHAGGPYPLGYFPHNYHFLLATAALEGNSAMALEAEEIFEADLRIFPKNGWALSGLVASLEGQQKNGEAKKVRTRFETAWAYADGRLRGAKWEG